MDSSAVAAGAALLGSLFGLVYSYLAERKRVADANRYRNHEQRAQAAVDFLEKLNAYRRDVRERKARSTESGQELEDVLGAIALFFDKNVVEFARSAQSTVNEAKKEQNGEHRERLLKLAVAQRDRAMQEMRHRLEPDAPKRRVAARWRRTT